MRFADLLHVIPCDVYMETCGVAEVGGYREDMIEAAEQLDDLTVLEIRPLEHNEICVLLAAAKKSRDPDASKL